jgi:SAM-dependent methyltransferase
MDLGYHFGRFAYRRFRAVKGYFMEREPDAWSRVFFSLQGFGEKVLSGRKLSKSDKAERRVWKAVYFLRFGTEPLYRLETEKPVAIDSSDHKWPHGTLYDNSTNPRFNLKLYDMFGNRPDLRVLDLGCSGGGFVKSVLDDGYTGVGIEGSDVSKRLRSGEWDTCPHHLLTSDITSRFQLYDKAGAPVTFHCITAWEVLEHIPTDKLPTLIDNIKRHLTPDGIFVASVATFAEANPVIGAVYHQTIQPQPWWQDFFAREGLSPRQHRFETQDYVRGHGRGLVNWAPEDGLGFHLVVGLPEAANRHIVNSEPPIG